MRILDVTLKDLSQIFRDKRSLFFLVAMPIVFTLFMGFAYRGGGDEGETDMRIPLGWVNQDPDGIITQQLYEMLSKSDSVKLVELSPEIANQTLQDGDVAGVLLVPSGFSELALENPAQLTLTTDPASTPGQFLNQMLRTTVTKLMSSVEIGRLSAEAVGMLDDATEINTAFIAAASAWAQEDTAARVKIELAIGKKAESWYGDNPYNQASPGILVMFVIFGLTTSGQILLQERKSRTLQRMITTSMPAWQIILGHLLAMFGVVFLQEILLILFGQLALGVDYLRQLLAVLLISVGLGLWIAAMGLLIGVLAKDDSQVTLFSLLAMFFFSALGGTWFPLEAAGGAFAVVSRLMPSAWAMTGYQNILIRGLGLSSAWLPAVIILAYALGFFLLAVWRFRKSEV